MKLKTAFRVSVSLGLVLLSGAVAAGPVGLWYTEEDDAQVEIAPCGDQLCGHIVWLEDPLNDEGEPLIDRLNPDESLQDRPIVGLRIVWDMEPKGNGKVWENGRVYDPESGKTYQARITLKGKDRLDLRGFVGTPMFGRTSTWTRADEPRAE